MADDSNKPLDEAHVEGGLYRVGDRVVDAEGKDLGDEGIAKADELDAQAKEKAEADKRRQQEQSASLATGGLAAALQTLAASAAVPAPAAKEPVKGKTPEAAKTKTLDITE